MHHRLSPPLTGKRAPTLCDKTELRGELEEVLWSSSRTMRPPVHDVLEGNRDRESDVPSILSDLPLKKQRPVRVEGTPEFIPANLNCRRRHSQSAHFPSTGPENTKG